MIVGRRQGKRSGLTLLEVLLALTIMLISLAAIGRLVDLGSDTALETRYETRGTQLVKSKLAEIEAGSISVSNAQSSPQPDEHDPKWNWSFDSEPQTIPNLYLVTVKASRDLHGKPYEVSISQMIFDPNMTGSAAQAEALPATTTSSTGSTSSSGSTGSSP